MLISVVVIDWINAGWRTYAMPPRAENGSERTAISSASCASVGTRLCLGPGDVIAKVAHVIT